MMAAVTSAGVTGRCEVMSSRCKVMGGRGGMMRRRVEMRQRHWVMHRGRRRMNDRCLVMRHDRRMGHRMHDSGCCDSGRGMVRREHARLEVSRHARAEGVDRAVWNGRRRVGANRGCERRTRHPRERQGPQRLSLRAELLQTQSQIALLAQLRRAQSCQAHAAQLIDRLRRLQ